MLDVSAVAGHGAVLPVLLLSFQLTDVSLVTYVTASTVGLIPTAVLNCYMGTTLRRMEDVFTDEKNQATGWIVLIVQVLASLHFYTPLHDSRRVLRFHIGCLCVRPSVCPG